MQLDGSSRVEFHKDKGAIGIHDGSGKLRLVYSAPVLRLSSGKTHTPDFEWDTYSSSISISLPDLSFPLVVAFGLSTEIPDVKGEFHFSFPSFKFGAKGEIESSDSESDSDSDEEKKKGGFRIGIKAPKFGFGGKKDKQVEIGMGKPTLDLPHTESSGKIKVNLSPIRFPFPFPFLSPIPFSSRFPRSPFLFPLRCFWFSCLLIHNLFKLGLPSFALKFPNFKLGASWTKSLYGDLSLPHVEIPHGHLSLHLPPSLNGLKVGLSIDGLASFEAPDWNLAVTPVAFSLSGPKLSNTDGLHLLRGEDAEIGISFDKHSCRHFFFYGKAPTVPKFSLGLKVYPPSPPPPPP